MSLLELGLLICVGIFIWERLPTKSQEQAKGVANEVKDRLKRTVE